MHKKRNILLTFMITWLCTLAVPKIMYMKKLLLGVIFISLFNQVFSQGFEDIIVEKIPVTAAAAEADANLTVNASAYRVFVDMTTGFELQAVLSLENHELVFETTTSFYNHIDYGATAGKDILTALLALSPALAFDTYITLDAATSTRLGILRSEDVNDGTVDGLVSGTALPLQTVGADFSIPFGTEMFSGKFSTRTGIYNVVGGEQGPTATNRVLVGQFTTDGDFSFELNLQIREVGSSNFVRYVARNPAAGEIQSSKLIYSSKSGPPPTITITSPVNGATFITGESVPILATAADADGSVSRVEFYVNGNKAGEDATSPYQYNWIALAGTTQFTAVATDNQGNQTTSAPVGITVTGQSGGAPVVSITSPTNGAKISVGTSVAVNASASDAGGSITLVEFYANGTKIGEDNTAPYQISWTAVKGSISLTARATDNESNTTLSNAVAVTVGDNMAPVVNITSPAMDASFTIGSQVNIEAVASDPDGSVVKVEFFRNNVKIGEDITAPYQMIWTGVSGLCVLTASATDNMGMKNASPQILITITGTNGTPPVVSITAPSNGSVFNAGNNVNIAAIATDADGSITRVEFFNNGTKLGEDITAPYSFSWTSSAGSASLTATATDNSGNHATSAPVNITVNGGTVKADTLVFDFSKAIINNNHYQLPVSVISGRDVTSFSFSMVLNTAKIAFHEVVSHDDNITSNSTFDQATKKLTITAASQQPVEKNKKLISVSFTLVTGAITPSDLTQFQAYINNEKCPVKLILTGTTPVPPTVSLASPAPGSAFNAGTSIPVSAFAADADGSVSMVEFFVNGNKIGEDAIAPYQVNWTGVAGTASLAARATDNQGNLTTSPVVEITVTGSGNQLPTVSITAPASMTEFSAGTVVSITATASDADGSVARVEFCVNDVLIGKDATAPYQINWTAVTGSAVIKANAIDNKGAKSAPVTVTLIVNAQPQATLTSPVEGAEYTAGQPVKLTATTQGGGGSIVLVEFFVNGIKVGQDDAAPYEYNWISTPGQAKVSAMVTDSKGAKTTSEIVTIHVNAVPVVDLIKPAEGSKFLVGEIIGLEATAGDPDGSITRVEFYVNSIKVGEDLAAPYQFDWTGTEGQHSVTATATDNKGASITSVPVTFVVINPYELGSFEQACNVDEACVPLKVTEPISDVIGFDMVMKFEADKVIPTGLITFSGDLINPDLLDYGVHINQPAGTIAVTVFLKSSAPEGTGFEGTGQLLCIEFTKTASFKPVDTVDFSVTSMKESYITGVVSRTVKPASLSTYRDYYFTGTLNYWSDNSPLSYDPNNPGQYLVTNIMAADPASCEPLAGTPVRPDLAGIFKYDVRNGTTIHIDRDIPSGSAVQTFVNGMDAQLGMKVALSDNSFVPSAYQMIALDVNMDGVVSSGDISQINQRSIMMIKEFKQAWNYNKQGVKIVDKPSKDWLFVEQSMVSSYPAFEISATYPEPDGLGYSNSNIPAVPACQSVSVSDPDGCPFVQPETYLGIMLGDVNGNYGSDGKAAKLKSSLAAGDTIVFDLSQALVADNKMRFPVYFTSTSEITSLDFEMDFNDDKLTYDTMLYHPDYIESAFFFNPEDSILRYTSYTLDEYPANQNLFYIWFDLQEEDISSSDFSIPLSILNGLPVASKVTEYVPTITGLPENHLRSEIHVFPNPARSFVYVQISEDAIVEILDLQGKSISESIRLVANEKQEISTDQLSSGLYLLKFRTDEGFAIKKLIINK
jgi:chitodextrinase